MKKDDKITVASAYIAMRAFLLEHIATSPPEDSEAIYTLLSGLQFFPYEDHSADPANWSVFKECAKLAHEGKLTVVAEYVTKEVEEKEKILHGYTDSDKRDWLQGK